MKLKSLRRSAFPLVFLFSLLFSLTACDGSAGSLGSLKSPTALPPGSGATATPQPISTTTSQPLATADPSLSSTRSGTPVIPAIQHIALGSFQARAMIPSSRGIALFGSADGNNPTNQAVYKALYFYDFSTHAIRTLSTPTLGPNGIVRGIGPSVVARDNWVIYIVYDQNSLNWELWANNLDTGKKTMIDSAVKENLNAPMDTFTTNGSVVVWSGPDSTARSNYLRSYNLQTGSVKTLATTTSYIYADMMMTGNSLFYIGLSQTPTLWLWDVTQPTPTQIPIAITLNVALNGNYVVWDTLGTGHASAQPLSLYNMVTGHSITPWGPSCLRPGIAPDRPYVICLDYDNNNWDLVRVESGASTPFAIGSADIGSTGINSIVGGKFYWIPKPNLAIADNQVDYFEIPTT